MTTADNGALSLSVTNNSSNTLTVILFQVYPGMDRFRASPLVWKATRLMTGSAGNFMWRPDFQFVAGTGQARPGGKFRKSTSLNVDPNSGARYTLSYNGQFGFSASGGGGQPGTLSLSMEGNIPQGEFAAGVGMDGDTVVVLAAYPNISVAFEAKPEYYIAAGDFKEGDILNLDSVQRTRVDFNGKSSMKAEYTQDGSWRVTAM